VNVKKNKEEVWYWHEKVEEYQLSGMGPKAYCDAYKVEYKKFSNMLFRFVFKKVNNPELYEKYMNLARKFLKSDMNPKDFCKIHDIDQRHLNETCTHIGYLDLIEEIKKEKQSEMKFIEVPIIPIKAFTPYMEQKSQEVLEKQNDLEIIISKGVKVSIAPNIDSMKIIKIIELLKDL
jgi:hypothetical protein